MATWKQDNLLLELYAQTSVLFSTVWIFYSNNAKFGQWTSVRGRGVTVKMESWTAEPPRLFLGVLLLCCLAVSTHEVPGTQTGSVPSAAKTLVWGPGLEANVVLPARFFYIQAVDRSGKK